MDLWTRSAPGSRLLAWGVLLAAVLEVVAPVVTINGPGASPGAGSGPDLLITPVGWAFSIWGVIYTLAIAQAVAALKVGAAGMPRRLQIDLLVLYLGGATWILLAAGDSSSATALALLVMWVAAVDGVLVTARADLGPRWFALLTRSAVGLYAGWVTAAFFLNLSTALVDLDIVTAGALGWQVGVLVVAVLVLLGLTVATRGLIAYAAAGTWALIGITTTAVSDGTGAVTALAVGGIIVLVAVTLAVQMRARVTSPEPSA